MKDRRWILETLGTGVLYLLHPMSQPAPRDGWWMACLFRDVVRRGWPPMDHLTVLELTPRLLYGWVYALWSCVSLSLGGRTLWWILEGGLWVGFWGWIWRDTARRGIPGVWKSLALVLVLIYVGPYVWFRPLSMALLLYAVLYRGLRRETLTPRHLPLLGWLWMQVHPSALLLVPMALSHPRYRRAVWLAMLLVALVLHPQLGMLVRAIVRFFHGTSGYTEWQSPLKVLSTQPGWGVWILLPFALAFWVWIRQPLHWTRGWLGFWMILALLTTRGYPFLVLTLAMELLSDMEMRVLSPRFSRAGMLLPWMLAGWFLLARGTPPHMPSPSFYRAIPEGTGWTRQDWANPVCWYQPRARVWVNGMDVPPGISEGERFWMLYFRILDGDPSPLMQAGIRWVITGPGMERLAQQLPLRGWRVMQEEGPYRLWVAQGSR